MAGAGYKLFSTGDVLSASDVNTYLQQQTVMVFASAAARTTALASVLAEGMVSYLKDTDVVEIYTGAAWVSLDDPNAIQNSIVDAKGDIISATADNTPARLAVGANNTVLTADSSTSTGLKWASPTASSGPTFRAYATSNQTVSANTFTKILFGSEDFDTDNCFASSNFTPTKAGYYLLTTVIGTTGATGNDYFYFYKNGVNYQFLRSPVSGSGGYQLTQLMYLNGTTDYANVYWYGSGITVNAFSDTSSFSGVWIRS